jgi:DNA-damage-inducible protein J
MTSITIRVDEQLKKNFDYMCDQFGLSNSAALNLFMKAVVRERRIPFESQSGFRSGSEAEGMGGFPENEGIGHGRWCGRDEPGGDQRRNR